MAEWEDSKDFISRKDAIDKLKEWSGGYSYIEIDTLGALVEFEKLPSAEPYTDEEIQKMQDMEQAQLEKAFKLGREHAKAEITDEQAIEHLQSTGWMQNHDREMYESGLRERLADDSGSYDSIIPESNNGDYISRQAAIDELDRGGWGAEWDKALARAMIESLPSAEPEIIRCKDCKHYTPVTAHCEIRGNGLYLIRGMDDFCSRAERRADE